MYLVLATAWNFDTPAFEAPDEDAHVRYVLFLADEGRLPDPRVEGERAGNESFHPPVYYAVLAIALRMTRTAYTPVTAERDPEFSWSTPHLPNNYFRTSSAPNGYLHFLRAFSELFGVVTVVCTYLAGSLLGAGAAVRASATTLTATLPQFTFISGAVNPDALAAALAAIGLVLLLHMLVGPTSRPVTVAAFGAVSGLAVLSEYHTIFLPALAGLAYLVVRPRRPGLALRDAAIAGGTFAAVAGWYFVFNTLRYGDPSGLAMQRLLAPELLTPRSLLSAYFLIPFPTLTYASFFGVFGWMVVFLPDVFYFGYGLLWLLALWGIGHGVLVSRTWPPERKLLILAPLLILPLVVYANLTFIAWQGRYFFPALPAVSLLLAFGLNELPRQTRRWGVLLAPGFTLAANLYALFLVASSMVRA